MPLALRAVPPRGRRLPWDGPAEDLPRSSIQLSERIARRARSLPLIADDLAVSKVDFARGKRGNIVLMRHQHDCHAAGVQFLQQRHDLNTGARVKRAGRLVGENQRGIVDQRARNRHALLLPA